MNESTKRSEQFQRGTPLRPEHPPSPSGPPSKDPLGLERGLSGNNIVTLVFTRGAVRIEPCGPLQLALPGPASTAFVAWDFCAHEGCAQYAESQIHPARDHVSRQYSCCFDADARKQNRFIDKAAREVAPFSAQMTILTAAVFSRAPVGADSSRLALALPHYSAADDASNDAYLVGKTDSAVSHGTRLLGVPTRAESREQRRPTIARPFLRSQSNRCCNRCAVFLPFEGTLRTPPLDLDVIAAIIKQRSISNRMPGVGLMRKAHSRFLLALPLGARAQISRLTGLKLIDSPPITRNT